MKLTRSTTFLFIAFLRRFIMLLTMFFLAIHLKNLHLSETQAGIAFSVMIFANIMAVFPTGALCDMVPSRIIMSTSAFLGALNFWLFATIHSFEALVFVFLLGGLAMSAFDIGVKNFIYKNYPDQTARMFGRYGSMDGLGMALGSLGGGIILYYGSFSNAFKISAIGFLLIAVLSLLLKEKSKSTLQKSFRMSGYISDICNFKCLLLITVVFLFNFHAGSENVLYSVFLKEKLKFDPMKCGLFFAGTQIVFVPLSILAGNLIRKRSSMIPTILVVAALLSGFFGAAFVLTDNPYLSFSLRLFHEVGDVLWAIGIAVFIGQFFQSERIGGNVGFLSIMTGLATIGSQLLSGMLAEKTGMITPFVISGILTLLLIPVFYYLLYYTERTKKPVAAEPIIARFVE